LKKFYLLGAKTCYNGKRCKGLKKKKEFLVMANKVHKGTGRNSRGGEQWIITYLSQWSNGKGKEKQKKVEKITRSLTQEGCSNRPSNRKVHN